MTNNQTGDHLEKVASNGDVMVIPNNKNKGKYYQAKRRKRKKPLMYFTEDTQAAIIEYNNETDEIRKNILYSERIYPALDKLAEITIHANKLYHFDTNLEDMKNETVTFLTSKLNKFDPESGFSAFSYFSVIAKRFLIVECKRNFKKQKRMVGLEYVDYEADVMSGYYRDEYNDETRDFIEMMVDFYDDNLDAIFTNPRDVQVADAVVDLFRNRENIENYNKKALYVLIRERTDVKTQYITSVIKEMEKQYKVLYEYYNASGSLDTVTISYDG